MPTLEELRRKELQPEGKVFTNKSLEVSGGGRTLPQLSPVGNAQPPRMKLENGTPGDLVYRGEPVDLEALMKGQSTNQNNLTGLNNSEASRRLTLESIGEKVYSPERVKSLEEAYDWTLGQIKKSTLMKQVSDYTSLANQLGEELGRASLETSGIRGEKGELYGRDIEQGRLGAEEKRIGVEEKRVALGEKTLEAKPLDEKEKGKRSINKDTLAALEKVRLKYGKSGTTFWGNPNIAMEREKAIEEDRQKRLSELEEEYPREEVLSPKKGDRKKFGLGEAIFNGVRWIPYKGK